MFNIYFAFLFIKQPLTVNQDCSAQQTKTNQLKRSSLSEIIKTFYSE